MLSKGRWFRCTLVSTLMTVAAGACATAGQMVFLAAANDTVTAETETSLDGTRQLIYAMNRSTQAVVVTSVQLRDCENIHNRCEVQRMRVPVGPRQRVLIATVVPENRDRAWSYHYSWTWEVNPRHE
jgi:hypothetical protein